MHADHQVFLDALHAKRRVSIRYYSRKEDKELERTCAPLDFGPLRGAVDTAPRYQLWDLKGKRKPLNVTVLPADIISIAILDEPFDPAAIITWAFKPNAWTLARDWGPYS